MQTSHKIKDLLQVLRDIDPESVILKDCHGNLSLHCVILEGINDIDLLDIVLDDDLNILNENDGKGRDILGMISSSMATFRIKILFQKWYETRTDGLCSSNVKMTHENYKCELEQLEHPIPMVLRKIDDLEWNNEQKDATIDSLSAQLMCLEKKSIVNYESNTNLKEMLITFIRTLSTVKERTQ